MNTFHSCEAKGKERCTCTHRELRAASVCAYRRHINFACEVDSVGKTIRVVAAMSYAELKAMQKHGGPKTSKTAAAAARPPARAERGAKKTPTPATRRAAAPVAAPPRRRELPPPREGDPSGELRDPRLGRKQPGTDNILRAAVIFEAYGDREPSWWIRADGTRSRASRAYWKDRELPGMQLVGHAVHYPKNDPEHAGQSHYFVIDTAAKGKAAARAAAQERPTYTVAQCRAASDKLALTNNLHAKNRERFRPGQPVTDDPNDTRVYVDAVFVPDGVNAPPQIRSYIGKGGCRSEPGEPGTWWFNIAQAAVRPLPPPPQLAEKVRTEFWTQIGSLSWYIEQAYGVIHELTGQNRGQRFNVVTENGKRKKTESLALMDAYRHFFHDDFDEWETPLTDIVERIMSLAEESRIGYLQTEAKAQVDRLSTELEARAINADLTRNGERPSAPLPAATDADEDGDEDDDDAADVQPDDLCAACERPLSLHNSTMKVRCAKKIDNPPKVPAPTYIDRKIVHDDKRCLAEAIRFAKQGGEDLRCAACRKRRKVSVSLPSYKGLPVHFIGELKPYSEGDPVPADHHSGDCDPPCAMCQAAAAVDAPPTPEPCVRQRASRKGGIGLACDTHGRSYFAVDAQRCQDAERLISPPKSEPEPEPKPEPKPETHDEQQARIRREFAEEVAATHRPEPAEPACRRLQMQRGKSTMCATHGQAHFPLKAERCDRADRRAEIARVEALEREKLAERIAEKRRDFEANADCVRRMVGTGRSIKPSNDCVVHDSAFNRRTDTRCIVGLMHDSARDEPESDEPATEPARISTGADACVRKMYGTGPRAQQTRACITHPDSFFQYDTTRCEQGVENDRMALADVDASPPIGAAIVVGGISATDCVRDGMKARCKTHNAWMGSTERRCEAAPALPKSADPIPKSPPPKTRDTSPPARTKKPAPTSARGKKAAPKSSPRKRR